MKRRLLSLVPGVLLMGAGCTPPGEPGATAAQLAGKDGPLTVGTTGHVANRYAQLAQDVSTGDRRLVVQAAAPLMPLGKGDLVLIIQMQGASIDTSDTATYGAVTGLNNAGRYELLTVDSVQGNEVVLDGGCRLRHSYTAAGAAQVIRVPQLTTLQVQSGASITAPSWNGATGGVVALHVKETATLTGNIDVSGRGFRGGQFDDVSGNNDGMNVIWRSNEPTRGGEKGEGIAGSQAAQIGGRYGRGAPANGGGGGNSHNAAGGGGANGHSGAVWSGHGVMDGTGVGAVAWTLDQAYVQNGNRPTTSSGGGRGGYTFSQSLAVNNPDPTKLGPGFMSWGGDWRREVGGRGGRPLQNDPTERLFMGGGGGAGDGNDMAPGSGGAGGGIVLLFGGAVTGTGQILADGSPGQNTRNTGSDAAGGGGAGGTLVVAPATLTGVRLSANGGKGGDQPNTTKLTANLEAEGPGGGGGGGYIAVSVGNIMTSAAGGANGLSASPVVATFPANGATRGAAGQALEAIIPSSVPVCFGEDPVMPDMARPVPDQQGPGGSDITVKITANPDPIVPDQPTTYTISVSNKGPDAARDVKVTFTVPDGATVTSIQPGAGWTCTQEGRVITCTRSEVSPGSAPDIIVKVTYPGDGMGPVTVGGGVTSSTPDPNPADNQTSVTTARGGISFAGGGFTCSLGRRGAPGQAGVLGIGLLGLVGVVVRGAGRRRRAASRRDR